MKHFRYIVLAAIATLGVFSAVLYSSCNKNKCQGVVCQHLGSCDGGTCFCLTGYEGAHCEKLMRDKFLFTYSGGDSCGPPVVFTPYQLEFVATLTDSLTMTMMNFLNNPADSAICTIQSTDSFTFIGANNATTYRGSGKLRNDSLWLSYSVKAGISTYSCKYFGQSLR
jgi:hypothetical protein